MRLSATPAGLVDPAASPECAISGALTVSATSAVLACLALAVVAPAAHAQRPETEIHVASLQIHPGHIMIGEPQNVTNRPGYDNQPWFTADGAALLYTADPDGQTDVFRLELASGTSTRLTNTPENEFSPSLSADGNTMLVVRWSGDMAEGNLWRYSPAGEPLGAHPADVPQIGYYGVADANTVLAFVNDSVRTFMWADARTGARTKLGEGIGGSPPQKIPGQAAMSFTQPDSSGAMWIQRLDLETRAVTPLVPVLGRGVNYAWTPDGVLLMAEGDAVYMRNPATHTEWQEVARFPGIGTISRIALSPAGDRVAFVVAPPEG